MASLFAVGLPWTYDGTTNHFATTTGGTATVAAVTSADDVTVDSLSGNATLTIGATWSCNTLTINNGSATVACDGTHGITASGAVTLTAGTLNTNGQTCTWASCSATGALTRTATFGASTINFTGSVGWPLGSNSNLTLSAASATFNFTGANAAFSDFTVHTYGTLNFTGSGTPNVQFVGSCSNFNRTGTAIKTDGVKFNNNFSVTGALTLAGNSITNRLLVLANVAGTQITITTTGATVTPSNLDISDLNLVPSVSLVGITGGSGDALGNTGITFDTPVTQTWNGNTTGNYSNAANWTSRVPLPQDNVLINGLTSGTITMDMPRSGNTIDCTGSTGGVLAMGTTNIFGSVTLAANMTTTTNARWTLSGRSALTFTSAGVSLAGPVTFGTVAAASYTLGSDFTSTSASASLISGGTFSTNNFNMTATGVQINTSFTTTNLGSSLITCNGTGSVWSGTGTINAGTSTIAVTDTSVTAKTFAGGGKTYNNLSITGGNGTAIAITGANNFNNISVTNPGTVLTLPSSTVTTTTSFTGTGQNFGYNYLPGAIASNDITAPNAAALQITGDVDVRALIAPTSWTPATLNTIIAKRNGASSAEYAFRIETTGKLTLYWFEGAVSVAPQSTVATGFSAGAQSWVRATRQNNVAGVYNVIFYTSPDGITWTKLGATVVGAAPAAPTSTTNALVVGSAAAAGNSSDFIGKMYRTQVYNGIAGTLAFDANFATKTFGANSFSESSSNAATVTIAGTSAQAGDGRILINSSTGGTAATLSSTSRVALDYVTVQDNTAAGNTPFYAGTSGVLVSGTTNWLINTAPGTIPIYFTKTPTVMVYR